MAVAKYPEGFSMKLIVSGSRSIADYETVKNAIDNLVNQGISITAIIEGTSRGVDRLASRYAQVHDIENIRVPADWKTYHKAAGPIRNRNMLEMGDALLALWDGASRGTMNMIKAATRKGIPVTVVHVSSGACRQTGDSVGE